MLLTDHTLGHFEVLFGLHVAHYLIRHAKLTQGVHVSVDGCGLNVTCDGVENSNGGWGRGVRQRGFPALGVLLHQYQKRVLNSKPRHSELPLMFSLFADSIHIHYMT